MAYVFCEPCNGVSRLQQILYAMKIFDNILFFVLISILLKLLTQ